MVSPSLPLRRQGGSFFPGSRVLSLNDGIELGCQQCQGCARSYPPVPARRRAFVYENAKMKPTAFSCVVDNTPLLLPQAFLWVNCLKRLRGVAASDIFVHTVEIDDQEFLTWLCNEEVNVVAIPRFHPLSPHCNKIQQLATFRDTNYRRVVLLDCDTAVIGDLDLPDLAPIGASIVHYGNPPAAVLTAIFERWVRRPIGSRPHSSAVGNGN